MEDAHFIGAETLLRFVSVPSARADGNDDINKIKCRTVLDMYSRMTESAIVENGTAADSGRATAQNVFCRIDAAVLARKVYHYRFCCYIKTRVYLCTL